MDVVCHDVEIEPFLQQLQGKTFDNKSTTGVEEARSKTKAIGLWDTVSLDASST